MCPYVELPAPLKKYINLWSWSTTTFILWKIKNINFCVLFSLKNIIFQEKCVSTHWRLQTSVYAISYTVIKIQQMKHLSTFYATSFWVPTHHTLLLIWNDGFYTPTKLLGEHYGPLLISSCGKAEMSGEMWKEEISLARRLSSLDSTLNEIAE
jgi:hypothetical protein